MFLATYGELERQVVGNLAQISQKIGLNYQSRHVRTGGDIAAFTQGFDVKSDCCFGHMWRSCLLFRIKDDVSRFGVAIENAQLLEFPEHRLHFLVAVLPDLSLLLVIVLPRFRGMFRLVVQVGLAKID